MQTPTRAARGKTDTNSCYKAIAKPVPPSTAPAVRSRTQHPLYSCPAITTPHSKPPAHWMAQRFSLPMDLAIPLDNTRLKHTEAAVVKDQFSFRERLAQSKAPTSSQITSTMNTMSVRTHDDMSYSWQLLRNGMGPEKHPDDLYACKLKWQK